MIQETMTFPVAIKRRSKRRLNVAKEVAEVNRIRLSFERSATTRFIKLFEKYGKQAARLYPRGTQDGALTVGLRDDVEKVIRAHYTDVITVFGHRVLDGYKFESRFEQMIDLYYLLYGADRVVGITNTTRNIIRGAIFAGEAEALGVAAISKLIIEKTSGSIGRARAATIARTETHAAASYATHETTKDLPITFRKEWSSVGDARTRSHHASMNGVQVGENEDFIVKVNGTEYRMAHTHDPRGGAVNNINCRCTTLYIADEDEIFRD